MTIQYRSVTAPVETAATTVTVTKPSGVVDGDLLIFYANNTNQGGASQILPPSGWTLIPGTEITGIGGIALWYKVASSEPANYTTQAVNISSILSCGIMAIYSDTASPIKIDVLAKQTNGSSTNRTFPSVTTTYTNTFLACFGSFGAGNSSTPDGAMTERWDVGSTKRTYLMTQSVSSAGATGTKVATGTAQTSNCVTLAFAEATQTAFSGPQFRETVVVASASKTSSQTITAPTTLAVGDMMLLQVAFGPSDATPTPPAGWAASEAITGASSIRIYWKIAVSADLGATYTVTFTGTKVIALAIVACYSPRGYVLAIDNTSSQSNGSASSATLTAVTTTQVNSFVAWFISANSSGTTFTGTDAINEKYDNAGGGQPRIACATELTFASGSTGTRTATYSSAQISNTATIAVSEVPPVSVSTGRVIGAKLWVKWTGSGSYSDESAYLMAFSGQVRLAPPLQTIMATRSIVDQVSVTLHNTSQRYSSLQSGGVTLTYVHEGAAYHSPMYLEVSINGGSTYTRIFTGVVKYITETAVTGREAGLITLDCRSREEEVLNTKISSTRTEFAAIYDGSENESQILARWLVDAGLSAGDYSLATGLYTIPWAWLNDESPIEQGWDLAAACGGRFYMRHVDGKFLYENSTAHLSQTSYATLTRAEYAGMSIKYPDTDLQKVVVVNVTDYDLQPLTDTIYSLDKPLTVAAGTTLIHEVSMSNPGYSVGVVAHTATNAGGFTITSDVTVTLTQYSQKLHFSIANANTTYAAVIRVLTVTGQAVAAATGTKRAYTATSGDSFWSAVTERKRLIDNRYVQSYGQAGGLANAVLAANGTPLQFTEVQNVLGDPAIVLGTKLTINDAIAMSGSKTYFVTSISFRYGVTGFFQTIECVEAAQLFPNDYGYFQINSNVLGSSTGSIAKLFF